MVRVRVFCPADYIWFASMKRSAERTRPCLPHVDRLANQASDDVARTVARLGRLADYTRDVLATSHGAIVEHRDFAARMTERLAEKAEQRGQMERRG
jgi:hypothetical protein